MKDSIKIALTVLWVLICIHLTACGGGGSGGDSAVSPVPDQNENQPEEVPPDAEVQLARFASEEELTDYLKSGLRARETGTDDFGGTPPPAAPAPENDGNFSGGGGSPPSFSNTNLQEAGVDEADLIKTDGRYLYIAATGDADVFAPMPEVADILPPSGDPSEAGPSIRIMEITADPPGSRHVATISLEEFENSIEGIYLLTNRGGNLPDLLVTIGGNLQYYGPAWDCYGCWQEGSAEIGLFDVSSPENPQQMTRLTLDGQLVASRRIDRMLYLVTRYTPGLPDYVPYPATDEEREENRQILDGATLSDLTPKVRRDGAEVTGLVRAEESYLPPLDEEREPEASLVTVTAIDLDQPENMISRSVAGPAEAVYVGTESLYVATVRYPDIFWDTFTGNTTEDDAGEPVQTTELHKFALTGTGPEYRGSGSVPGTLGWEEDKKPFRMSEYDETLRVATSLGNDWDGSATTRLTLLQEGENASLVETGAIDNIGKPGERLYAVRFVGGRAYLVTFRVTDPFYVFDLSDPTRPIELGELQIEGYSDYLHPVSENLLLGIGKDAVPDASSNDFGGRGAWYQGLKLSLFDVSVPSAPTEVDSIIIGKRGTQSEALYDHHALAWLPATDQSPARLALPVRLHDRPGDNDWFDPARPNSYYDWTHTGLYLFEIDNSGVTPAGRMVVEEWSAETEYPYWWSDGGNGDRAVLLDGSVHYVHGAKVWSAAWETPEEFSGPE